MSQPHDFIFVFSFISVNHGSICSVHLTICSHVCSMQHVPRTAYRAMEKYQAPVFLLGKGGEEEEKVRETQRPGRKKKKIWGRKDGWEWQVPGKLTSENWSMTFNWWTVLYKTTFLDPENSSLLRKIIRTGKYLPRQCSYIYLKLNERKLKETAHIVRRQCGESNLGRTECKCFHTVKG